MRLGLLTSALPQQRLEEVARWAAAAGYQALEVAAWPAGAGGVGAVSHLDPAQFGPADAEGLRALLGSHNLTHSGR